MKYIKRTKSDIKKDFVKNLLIDRGILTEDADYCKKFFYPTKENEIDPSLLDNIEQGYQLLMKHLQAGNKFYLLTDPDIDGFTSASLFYNYLMEHFSKYKPNIEYHIPEGKEHGLDSIMDWFPESGDNSLIVIPDAGSNDIEQHKELAARGYEILVLDHHLVSSPTDNAVVINNQSSAQYSNKDLSGVGVVYKFFEYVEQREKLPAYSEQYLDLVALGQIGDMMRFTTLENRFILTYGLSHLNNKLFSSLIKKQEYSLKGELTQMGIAFYIVPLINSIIRLGSPQDKEKIFLAFTHPELEFPSKKRGALVGDTENICDYIGRIGTNTKNRQNKERDKALELFDIQIIENCLDENKLIILNADDLDIPKTLTGLCAMGVVSKYKKPVLVGRSNKDGTFKGSLRAPGNTPIKDFKEFLLNSNLMDFVEGHSRAAGYSLKISNIDKLVNYANKELANIDFNEGFWEVDFLINGNCSYLSELIEELFNYNELWGQGNPEVLIAVKNININPKTIMFRGESKNTIAFTFNGIEYIKFKDDELAHILENAKDNNSINLTIVGTPQINTWGGKSTKQIQIKAVEVKETNIYDF